MHRPTTIALAAALAFSGLALGPADGHEDASLIDRAEDPCGPDAGEYRLLQGPTNPWNGDQLPDYDLCGAEMVRTIDASGTLTGLQLSLEVDGDVAPRLDRTYAVTLASVQEFTTTDTVGGEYETDAGCDVTLILANRGLGPVLEETGSCYFDDRNGRATDVLVSRESRHAWTVEGGTLTVDVDLSQPDDALLELLVTAVDGFVLSASVNGFDGDMRSFMTDLVLAEDRMEPGHAGPGGEAPDSLDADLLAACDARRKTAVTSDRYRFPEVFCAAEVTGDVDGGELATVTLTASVYDDLEVPDRFGFRLDGTGCYGQVDVALGPEGSSAVTASGWNCAQRDSRLDGSTAALEAVHGTVIGGVVDVLGAADAPWAAVVACIEGTPEDCQTALGDVVERTPADAQAGVEAAAQRPQDLAAAAPGLAEGLAGDAEMAAQYAQDTLSVPGMFAGVSRHLLDADVVVRGNQVTVTIAVPTGYDEIDGLFRGGRAFAGGRLAHTSGIVTPAWFDLAPFTLPG